MKRLQAFLIGIFVAIVAITLSFSLVAQDTPEDMEAVHKETIIRIVEEGFNQGNLDVIDEFFAPDYVNHIPGNNIENRDDFKAFISDFRGGLPDFEATVGMFVAEDDWIAFHFTMSGTFENEIASLPGLPPNGEVVELLVNVILQFNEDGQIINEWDVGDNFPFLMQLGVIPPMEAEATE